MFLEIRRTPDRGISRLKLGFGTLVALLLTLLSISAANAQDLGGLGEEDPFAAALSDIEQDLGSGWWDDDWKLRQLLIIDDPGFAAGSGKPVFLDQPEPLLLYNTGRAEHGLTDVRLVDLKGNVLESGVVRFGNDDGSSMIWVVPPTGKITFPYRLYVYYGNPDAPEVKTNRDLDRPDKRKLVTVNLGPEEAADGGELPADESFFDNLRSIEFESFVDKDGNKPGGVYSRDRADFIVYTREGASGDWVAAGSVDSRSYESADWPINGYSEIDLPEAGTWYVHVRYRAGVFKGHRDWSYLVRKLDPFKVTIGEHEVTAGVNQNDQAEWEWDTFELELPKGKVPLKVTWLGRCAPDAMLFTKDKKYIPDYRDVTGPVWMRFRLVGDSSQPFFAQMYCVDVPWSSSGPQGTMTRFYLKETAVPIIEAVEALGDDRDQYMRYNEWSTWGESMSSAGITWWTQMAFLTRPDIVRRAAIREGEVEFEFATRPIAGRRFRSGKTTINDQNVVNIRMPENPGLWHVLNQTRSFDQWAEHRIEEFDKLDLAEPKHPKKIFLATMARAHTDRQRELIFKHISDIGFSSIDIRMDIDQYLQLSEKYGLDAGHVAHHWRPDIDLAAMPNRPPEGQTYTDWIVPFLREHTHRQYSPEGRWYHHAEHCKLIIMGDEIGPSTVWFYINASPMLLGYFREWLAEKGCTPADFGKADWSEVYALGYETPSTKSQARLKQIDDTYESDDEREVRVRDSTLLEAALREGASWASNIRAAEARKEEAAAASTATGDTGETAEGEEIAPDTMTAAITTLDEIGDESAMVAEEAAADKRYALAVPQDATIEEKRLYHWTQEFRSEYTAMLHKFGTEGIERSYAAGHFLHKPVASPNFQAMPAQKGRMWTGALNLFDLGRGGALKHLQLEDWTWNPYKMAFGMEIMRAAGRRDGATLGSLIVGGGVELRAIACLAIGSEAFLSYLYGPQRVIGPPWAEHMPSQIQWHKLSRWMANLETDMLATTRRPADVGILVANTTELNSAFIETPLWERQYLYMTLMNSGIPVEAVGEEEVIEDEALSRYKVLYVADMHVDSRAQEKIKAWVKNGGVIWGASHALAREEYDQPTDRFDEVFGLSSREPMQPADERFGPDAQPKININAGDYLKPVAMRSIYRTYPLHPADDAEVLATFEDGSAAMVRHQYGKGTAFLTGFSSVNPHWGADKRATESPEDAAAMRVADIGAQVAGARRHAVVGHPRVIYYVNDGPDQTMLYLLNCHEDDVKAIDVKVMTDRPVNEVVNGDLEAVAFKPVEGGVSLKVDIESEAGLIFVLRH